MSILSMSRTEEGGRGGGEKEEQQEEQEQGKYLQLKCTVSMPEKISICLSRGRKESLGNDDVSIFCARKYEKVRMRLTKNPEGTA